MTSAGGLVFLTLLFGPYGVNQASKQHILYNSLLHATPPHLHCRVGTRVVCTSQFHVDGGEVGSGLGLENVGMRRYGMFLGY